MKIPKNPYPGGPEYSLNITRQTNTKGLQVMTTRETPNTHNLGKMVVFYCVKCGRHVSNCYETDPARGAGIHEDLHYCSKCGNPVDFGEVYHKPKLKDPPPSNNDEIKFEEDDK